jgi:hypothetical protein
MKVRWGVGLVVASCFLLGSAGCTGGQETEAQTLDEKPAAEPQGSSLNAASKLQEISPAIPLYAGATYRSDLSRRDSVMVRQQFGQNAEVLTLGTNDSFPQVWHYYVTYLAQFRAYEPPSPLPPGNKEWRMLEVHLNEAMQDPFIPGDMLSSSHKQVILQIAETEAEPETVIRYIVTTAPPDAAVLLQ